MAWLAWFSLDCSYDISSVGSLVQLRANNGRICNVWIKLHYLLTATLHEPGVVCLFVVLYCLKVLSIYLSIYLLFGLSFICHSINRSSHPTEDLQCLFSSCNTYLIKEFSAGTCTMFEQVQHHCGVSLRSRAFKLWVACERGRRQMIDCGWESKSCEKCL